MKVLVTGAGGQLGKEVIKQLMISNDFEVIATDHKELSIEDFVQVEKVLNNYMPEIVINCAAYTAVDDSETNIEKAYQINALGPKHLAIICDKIGAKLVHISTDYVFSGDEKTSRKEDDETRPNTIYGKSKLMGEELVKTFCKKHFIIRTAWLYGEGNNFVRTMLRLAQTQEEIDVVADQFGSPTSTKDLTRTIITLMQTEYYGTFHGTCEGECSWYEFACYIFKLKNCKVKVNKVSSEIFTRPAPRPKYSVLDNFMLKLYGIDHFRAWEDALQDYLREE